MQRRNVGNGDIIALSIDWQENEYKENGYKENEYKETEIIYDDWRNNTTKKVHLKSGERGTYLDGLQVSKECNLAYTEHIQDRAHDGPNL